MRPSPTINLLVVTARPQRRPRCRLPHHLAGRWWRRLRQAERAGADRDPPPRHLPRLVQHLEDVRDQHGAGYYHVIHFDTHGAVLTLRAAPEGMRGRALRSTRRATAGPTSMPYEGRQGLPLPRRRQGRAGRPGRGRRARGPAASRTRCPIAILNACQSGKQVGASETSLGSRLMQAGLQLVLAMGYSVTVSAAERLMQHALRPALRRARTWPPPSAARRLELYNQKARRAYFDQTIDLEDWLLPVVYQNQPVRLRRRASSPRRSRRPTTSARPPALPRPETAYGFVGRDLDILADRAAACSGAISCWCAAWAAPARPRCCAISAAGGRRTGFVEQVFSFGYDERAWTRQQILVEIARQLLGEVASSTRHLPAARARRPASHAGPAPARRAPPAHPRQPGVDHRRASRHPQHAAARRSRRRCAASWLTWPAARPWCCWARAAARAGSRRGPSKTTYTIFPGSTRRPPRRWRDRILERHGAATLPRRTGPGAAPDSAGRLPAGPAGGAARTWRTRLRLRCWQALQAGDVSLDAGDSRGEDRKHPALHRLLAWQPLARGAGPARLPGAVRGRGQHGSSAAVRRALAAQPALADLPFERWQEVLQEADGLGAGQPHELPGYLHCSRLSVLSPQPTALCRAVGGEEGGGDRISPTV